MRGELQQEGRNYGTTDPADLVTRDLPIRPTAGAEAMTRWAAFSGTALNATPQASSAIDAEASFAVADLLAESLQLLGRLAALHSLGEEEARPADGGFRRRRRIREERRADPVR